MKKPPFELDRTLLRYLSDIEFLYDQRQGLTLEGDSNAKRNQVLVDRFTKEDEIDHNTEGRFTAFEKHFESKKILRFLSYSDYLKKQFGEADNNKLLGFYELRDPYKEMVFEKSLFIEVLKIDDVRKFRKEHTYTFDNATIRKLHKDNDRILYMNEAGQFFYGKERREIKFDVTAGYYQCLVAIYLATNACGEITIPQLNKKLKTQFGLRGMNYLSVKNAIHSSIKDKLNGLNLPNGEKILECSKTRNNVIFTNPVIESQHNTDDV